MSWKTDQYIPTTAVVREVVESALKPRILAILPEIHVSSLRGNIGVWKNNECKLEASAVSIGLEDLGGVSNCEIRLRFRRTIKAERSLFFAQLRMVKPLGQARFAGIIITGEIKEANDGFCASSKSCTVIYNRCDWSLPPGLTPVIPAARD